MAITCPRCGRGYDVTLFEFGRTIICSCGARVSLETGVQGGSVRRHGEARFLADAMLGRLARWLRYLGYDAAYEADILDAVLAQRALAEGRILLTRDRALVERWRLEDAFLVEGDEPLGQLRQVVMGLGLRWRGRERSRCTVCNGALVALRREEARGRVPPYVYAHHRSFTRCPACGRIYWRGTHAQRMDRILEETLGSSGVRPEPGSPPAS